MDNVLEKAITLATAVHIGQKDKLGEPYILHPLRVMAAFEDESARVTAVLHDVCEDSPNIDPLAIAKTFGAHIGVALNYLTRRDGEEYQDYIQRCAGDPLAKRVKIEDLKDNLGYCRIYHLDHQTCMRLRQKYRPALLELLRC